MIAHRLLRRQFWKGHLFSAAPVVYRLQELHFAALPPKVGRRVRAGHSDCVAFLAWGPPLNFNSRIQYVLCSARRASPTRDTLVLCPRKTKNAPNRGSVFTQARCLLRIPTYLWIPICLYMPQGVEKIAVRASGHPCWIFPWLPLLSWIST